MSFYLRKQIYLWNISEFKLEISSNKCTHTNSLATRTQGHALFFLPRKNLVADLYLLQKVTQLSPKLLLLIYRHGKNIRMESINQCIQSNTKNSQQLNCKTLIPKINLKLSIKTVRIDRISRAITIEILKNKLKSILQIRTMTCMS